MRWREAHQAGRRTEKVIQNWHWSASTKEGKGPVAGDQLAFEIWSRSEARREDKWCSLGDTSWNLSRQMIRCASEEAEAHLLPYDASDAAEIKGLARDALQDDGGMFHAPS